MRVRPIHPYFGVEIYDFDANAPLSEEERQQIVEAFKTHRLLLVRGQEIGTEAQIALVDAITPATVESTSGEKFSFVSTRPNEYVSGSDRIIFHADYNFTDHGPVQLVSLCALIMERPEPTLFTDSVAAVRRLPEELRERLRGLSVVQCQEYTKDTHGGYRQRLSKCQTLPEGQYSVGTYAAIRPHPMTGEEVLMHAEQNSSHFLGMSEAESDVLFAQIAPYQYVEEQIYQHAWQQGDLLIWDNIALQHGRHKIAEGSRRTLRRVAGNPVPARDLLANVRPDESRFTYKEGAAKNVA